jgi:hypothetical protein
LQFLVFRSPFHVIPFFPFEVERGAGLSLASGCLPPRCNTLSRKHMKKTHKNALEELHAVCAY